MSQVNNRSVKKIPTYCTNPALECKSQNLISIIQIIWHTTIILCTYLHNDDCFLVFSLTLVISHNYRIYSQVSISVNLVVELELAELIQDVGYFTHNIMLRCYFNDTN